MKTKLSIVILNYNTSGLLKDCLNSLMRVKNELNFEVIVCDNGSSDNSVGMLKKNYKWVKVLELTDNSGFAKGNNKARKFCNGEYVLFLNSDTKVFPNTLKETVNYLNEHEDVGAVGCKTVLSSGGLDKDARRSFITPWIGFTHLFLRLDRIFPTSRLFSKYWYGYLSADTESEVDSLQGAFMMVRRGILDQVDWFDESYFLDAEDIDLCWKIKKAGWKVVYYPKVSILHLKGATKGKNKVLYKHVKFSEKLKYRMSGVNSMEIFYKKRLWGNYPMIINILVLAGIKVVKTSRFIKMLITG